MKFNTNILSLAATLAAFSLGTTGVNARAVVRSDDIDPRGPSSHVVKSLFQRQDDGDRELHDWGLVRNQYADEEAPDGAFVGHEKYGEATWQRFEIAPAEENLERYGEQPVMNYNVLVNEDGSGAFDIRWVKTEDRDLPPMAKRRNLLINSFQNAGGDLTQLQVMGDSDVVNEDVRNSIRDALAKKDDDDEEDDDEDDDDEDDDDSVTYEPRTEVFTENGRGWAEIQNNAFIGGYQKMINEIEALNNARISEILVIIRDDGTTYDMRTTLSRV